MHLDFESSFYGIIFHLLLEVFCLTKKVVFFFFSHINLRSSVLREVEVLIGLGKREVILEYRIVGGGESVSNHSVILQSFEWSSLGLGAER